MTVVLFSSSNFYQYLTTANFLLTNYHLIHDKFMTNFIKEGHCYLMHKLSIENAHVIIRHSKYWGKVDHFRERRSAPGPQNFTPSTITYFKFDKGLKIMHQKVIFGCCRF